MALPHRSYYPVEYIRVQNPTDKNTVTQCDHCYRGEIQCLFQLFRMFFEEVRKNECEWSLLGRKLNAGKHEEQDTFGNWETTWLELRNGECASKAGESPRGQTLQLFLSCFKLVGAFLQKAMPKIVCKWMTSSDSSVTTLNLRLLYKAEMKGSQHECGSAF